MSYTSAILRVMPSLPLGRGTDSFGLTEGQLLRAVVLRSGGGTADLLLQGQVLQLKTELSLVPGTPLLLQVREAGADGVTLALAPETAASQPGTSAPPATRPAGGRRLARPGPDAWTAGLRARRDDPEGADGEWAATDA